MPIKTRKMAWALCSSVLLVSPTLATIKQQRTSINGSISVGYRSSELNDQTGFTQAGLTSFDPNGSYIDLSITTYHSDYYPSHNFGATARFSLEQGLLSDMNEYGYTRDIDQNGLEIGTSTTIQDPQIGLSEYSMFINRYDMRLSTGKAPDLITQMNRDLSISNTNLIRSINLYDGTSQLPSYLSDVSGQPSGDNPYFVGLSYASDNTDFSYYKTYKQTSYGMVSANQFSSNLRFGEYDRYLKLSTALSTTSHNLSGKASAVDHILHPELRSEQQSTVGLSYHWNLLDISLSSSEQHIDGGTDQFDDDIEINSASIVLDTAIKLGYSIMESEHVNVDDSAFVNHHFFAEHQFYPGLNIAYHHDHYAYDKVRLTPRTESLPESFSVTDGEGSADTVLMTYTF